MRAAPGVRTWRQRGRRLAVIACLTPVAVDAQSADAAWHAIAPGGRTRCAFDTPFEFWVREANRERVFIYLQGGGACWSLDSCRPGPDIAFDRGIEQRRTPIANANQSPPSRATEL